MKKTIFILMSWLLIVVCGMQNTLFCSVTHRPSPLAETSEELAHDAQTRIKYLQSIPLPNRSDIRHDMWRGIVSLADLDDMALFKGYASDDEDFFTSEGFREKEAANRKFIERLYEKTIAATQGNFYHARSLELKKNEEKARKAVLCEESAKRAILSMDDAILNCMINEFATRKKMTVLDEPIAFRTIKTDLTAGVAAIALKQEQALKLAQSKKEDPQPIKIEDRPFITVREWLEKISIGADMVALNDVAYDFDSEDCKLLITNRTVSPIATTRRSSPVLSRRSSPVLFRALSPINADQIK